MAEISKLLKNIEYLFIAVILFCLGYMGYFFLMKNNTSNQTFKTNIPQQLVDQTMQDFVAPATKPYEVYSDKINTRDIFTQHIVVPVKPTVSLSQLPPNFKIVGIVMGQSSQVIVEDSNTHETYFINKNTPQGGIALEKMEKDKVFLNYQGQSIQVIVKSKDE